MTKHYKSLKDHVYDYISEQILEEKLKPDERINETLLAQELSVSRTPVREALIQLSCEGILQNTPRKGFVICELHEKEAAQLYTVIGGLDGLAAMISFDVMTEKEYLLMEYYIQSIDSAINTRNYAMYLNQQDEFHRVYLDKCDNDVLYDTITRLKSKLFTRGHTSLSFENEIAMLKSCNDEHRQILELFKTGDKNSLYQYISQVHWSTVHAHREILSSKKKKKK